MNNGQKPVESLVSVVIPAYNHERYVGAAVESVLAQTYSQWELIVIDDGSTDGTPEVLRRYTDPRIRVFRQVNQDAYNAINAGLAKTTGEFVAILNSDDMYHPDRLARLVAVQRESGAACLFTDVQPIDASGQPITDPLYPWLVWHAANRQIFFDVGDLYTAFLNGNFMIGTSNLFLTAETVRQVGSFAPLRYLHDYDYIFRVLLAAPGRVQYLHDEKLMSYRIHGANTLSQGAIIAREQDQQVIRTYLLAGVPEASRQRVSIGAERLAKLERELAQVRAEWARPAWLRRGLRYRAWLGRKWAKLRHREWVCGCLILALGMGGAVAGPEVRVGATTAEVFKILGPPESELPMGDELSWSYPAGNIVFRKGRVFHANLLSVPEVDTRPPIVLPPSSPAPEKPFDPLALEPPDPFFQTIQEGDEKMLSLLLARKIDPNRVDSNGYTPLARVISNLGIQGTEESDPAVRARVYRMVRRLLKAGARVDLGRNQVRPLDLANQVGDRELMELLQQAMLEQNQSIPPESLAPTPGPVLPLP